MARRRPRRIVLCTVVLLGLWFAGCGDGEGGTKTSAPATTTVAVAAATSSTQNSTDPTEWLIGTNRLAPLDQQTTWAGTISPDIGFTMKLAQRDDLVLGEIVYDSVGEPISLMGRRFDNPNQYFLQEIGEDGRISGYLTFTGVESGRVDEATWGERAMILDLASVSDHSGFQPRLADGEYRYAHAPFDDTDDECCGGSGVLSLTAVGPESATLAFDNARGAPGFNLATVEQVTVPKEENRALYDMTDESLDCSFEVVGFDRFVFVEYVDQRFDCDFGAGAGVSGFYVRVSE